jgi:flavin reductase (DIM6/NTAB) family NADH-FMN oxidoreductase RutF
MRLHLISSGNVVLRDPWNFRQLDILVDPQDERRLARSLARIGRREDQEHVRVAPALLRFLSGFAGDSSWETCFENMIDSARASGWIDELGEIRAHLTTNSEVRQVSASEFKAAMRMLPAGISAITTGTGDTMNGVLVSSLTSISADPPLVGFFLHQDSSCYAVLVETQSFVANILGEQHGEVMACFTEQPQGPRRFSAGHWFSGLNALPVLSNAVASLECEITFTQLIGTHWIVVGRIIQSTARDAPAVVHYRASTHRLEKAIP